MTTTPQEPGSGLDDIDPEDISVAHDNEETGLPDADPDAAAQADEDDPPTVDDNP